MSKEKWRRPIGFGRAARLKPKAPVPGHKEHQGRGATNYSRCNWDGSRRLCRPTVYHRQVYGQSVIRVDTADGDEQSALLGIDRHSPGEPAPGLRSDAVALVHVVEDETSAPD
jgi:hypothetical protein